MNIYIYIYILKQNIDLFVASCFEEGIIYNIGEVFWKPNGDSFLNKCECLASHSGSSFSCQTCKFKVFLPVNVFTLLHR